MRSCERSNRTLVQTKTTGSRPLAIGGLGPFLSEPKHRLLVWAFVEMDIDKQQVNMRAEENIQNMINNVHKNSDIYKVI